MRIKNSRKIAGITCFLIAFVLIFSFIFIAERAEHDCTGTDCPICACLQQAQQIIHQLGTGTEQVNGTILLTGSMVLFVLPLIFFVPCGKTLVDWKIRLDD